MRKPNVVVVGYGTSGRAFHCYLVRLVPELHLYGVVARNPEIHGRIVSEQQCKVFQSIEVALQDTEVDSMILATPNSTHSDLAIRANRAGKHVVTDKVMCLSIEECNRMIDTAQNNNVLLTVFQNRRFDGDYLTVSHLMENGELGDVRWIEMAWQGFTMWKGWRGQAESGGGRFLDLGAHLVDQMCMLFPDPIETVYCRMHHDDPSSDIETEALLVITFAGGKTGVIDTSSKTAVSKPRFLVHGSNATFVKYGLDPQEAAMKAGDIDSATEDEMNYGQLCNGVTERIIPTIAGRWRNYYENIAHVLTNGEKPEVKYEEMYRTMAILDAGIRSAKTGKAIQVNIPGL